MSKAKDFSKKAVINEVVGKIAIKHLSLGFEEMTREYESDDIKSPEAYGNNMLSFSIVEFDVDDADFRKKLAKGMISAINDWAK